MMQGGHESLWLKLLHETTQGNKATEALVVLVGDVDTNKKSLLQYLCNHRQKMNPSYDESLLQMLESVNYDYFDIDENSLESTARVNVWSVDHRMFHHLPGIVKVKSKEDTRLLFLIALDLSKGEEVLLSFKRWTKLIVEFIHKYFEEVSSSSDKRRELQELWKYYISTVRITKGSKLLIEKGSSHVNNGEETQNLVVPRSGLEHTPFPIIVVGFNHTQVTMILQNTTSSSSANASTSNINELLQVNKFKDLIGKLRYYCLDMGIALLLTPSIADPLVSSSNNDIPPLTKYVMHRLFPDYIGMDLTVEEKLDRTFIPSGFDTLDMIQISSGVKYLEKEFSFSSWVNSVPNFEEEKIIIDITGTATPSNAVIEVENEQDWLQGLHSFIAQIAQSGNDSSKAPTTNLNDLLADAEHENQEKKKKLVSNLSNNNLGASISGSSTNPSSKNVSPNNTRTDAPPASTTTSKPVPRKPTTRSSATSSTNTQDFFKSLLEGNPKK